MTRFSYVTTHRTLSAARPARRAPAFRCLRRVRKTTAQSVAATGAPISTFAWPTRTAYHREPRARVQTRASPLVRGGAAVPAARPLRARRGFSVNTPKCSIAVRSQALASAPNSPRSARRSGRQCAAATRATTATTVSRIPMACRFGTAAYVRTPHRLPPERPARSAESKARPTAPPVSSVSSLQPPNAERRTSPGNVSPVPRRARPTTIRSVVATQRHTPTHARRRQPACR